MMARLPLLLALLATVVVTSGWGAFPGLEKLESPLTLPSPLPQRTLVLPILMYHRIGALTSTLPAITQRLTVTPAVFDEQMTWLKRHGFHAVSQLQAFLALEHGARLPPKPIMITFDDGYRDVLWNASPVLERLRMPATEYVITGRTSGPDPSFLTWGELNVLQQRGITIGSHTVTHRPLTWLTPADAYVELRDSRRALARHLGHPVDWFAYPYGDENATVVTLARKAGYLLAVTTSAGMVQDADQPLLLHRQEIIDTTGVTGLAGLLHAVDERG